MTKLCFVPIYMQHHVDPVLQFLKGTGELSSESGAFNLYEYLLTSSERDYPIILTIDPATFIRESSGIFYA